MGMYSNFYIKVESHGEPCNLEEVKDALHKIAEYSFYVSGNIINSGDEIKWCSWDDDMITLSEKFPKLRFKVFRDYEEGCYMNQSGFIENTHTYKEFENGRDVLFKINISLVPQWYSHLKRTAQEIIMVNSKRYKDEFNNRIILEKEDDDFVLRLRYDREQFNNQPDDY